MREKLKDLVSPPVQVDDGVPEYETQDDVGEWSGGEDDGESKSDEPHISLDLKFDELVVGKMVEVYWKGDDKWYEGEVTDIGREDKTFEIFYCLDEECLWHAFEDYPLRLSC